MGLWQKIKEFFWISAEVIVSSGGSGTPSTPVCASPACASKPYRTEDVVFILTSKTNPAGVSLIKSSEGLRLKRYICPGGKDTIGWGHVILPGEDIGDEITEDEAEELLMKDIRTAEQSVNRLVKVPLNNNQYSALVSFTFNLGGGALQSSTLLHKLNAGDYEGAANEFPRWVYAAGTRLKGLIRRRQLEQQLFLS